MPNVHNVSLTAAIDVLFSVNFASPGGSSAGPARMVQLKVPKWGDFDRLDACDFFVS